MSQIPDVNVYHDLIKAGRRSEVPLEVQRHMAQFVVITTETAYHDLLIHKRFRPVQARAVYGSNFIRDWFASIRDFFGGRIRSSESILDKAFAETERQLQHKTWLLGANYIVGVSFAVAEVSSKNKAGYSVVAYGTPIFAEELTREQQLGSLLRSPPTVPAEPN